MSTGGSGLVTLLSEKHKARLAYMQVLHEVQPQPVTAEGHAPTDAGGRGTYRFYELWNEPTWRKLAQDIGANPWEALLAGLADGSIVMKKIFRSPAGPSMCVRRYNTQAATVEAVDENDCVMLFDLPKEITVTGHLAGTVLETAERAPLHPDEHPVRTYVAKVDDGSSSSVRLYGEEALAKYLKDLKLDPGQTISITG